MIIRTDGNRNQVLLRRIKSQCDALRPCRADDNIDFRRACQEGLESKPGAGDLSDVPPKGELTDCEILAVDDDAVWTDGGILQMVLQALNKCRQPQLRHLQIACVHGCVTLTGSLPTYYLKQVAQSAIRSVAGVREIINQVDVSN